VYWRWWSSLRGDRDQAHNEDDIPAGDEVPAQSSQESDRRQPTVAVWQLLGAGVAGIPFLVPVLGPRLVPGTRSDLIPDPAALSALLGLVGSLLWALFLGYGRDRLLDSLPFSPHAATGVLRLGWLLGSLGVVLDRLGRVLLRFRAIVEGEHYLAWAILLSLGLGLLFLLR
jgi:hypothetical protein